MREGNVIVVGAGGGRVSAAMLRQVRGSFWQGVDLRFFIVALLSLIVHAVIISILHQVKLRQAAPARIEEMPARFARLIVEKPVPKTAPVSTDASRELEKKSDKPDEKEEGETATPEKQEAVRRAAKKRVAARAAQVEKKIRTVGVLGMLTGVGGKGPAVVSVLGSERRERNVDLEKALKNMSGLKRTEQMEVLDRKLVRSKDLEVTRHEDINDLVASIGNATSASLSKRGNFIIKKPESIEGAASANTKRDTDAINQVVSQNKRSLRMSYEKYLKRDPSLAGKITVRFTIASTGRVSRIEILENTTRNADLENDIKRKIKMWRFEEIEDGEVTVTYPFVFSAS